MKVNKITSTFFLALTLFGCDDTQYSDPHVMPVKVSGVQVSNVYRVRQLSDGTVALPVNDSDGNVKIAKVRRDGSVWYSDAFATPVHGFSVNASGECLVYWVSYDDFNDVVVENMHVIKIDRLGKVVFEGEKILEQGMEFREPVLHENGEIEYIIREHNGYNWDLDEEKFLLKRGFFGSSFVQFIDADYYLQQAFLFDSNWFAVKNSNCHFYIYDAEGLMTGDGELPALVESLKYIDGHLYIIASGKEDDVEEGSKDELESGGAKSWVIKMDTFGHQVYSIKIDASIINLTVSDGKVYVTGSTKDDNPQSKRDGAIFVLDDVSGGIMSTVTMSYNGCEIIPLVISPDQNGEYDIFATRREDYSGFIDFGEYASNDVLNTGQLFVLHIDDLGKLDIKN